MYAIRSYYDEAVRKKRAKEVPPKKPKRERGSQTGRKYAPFAILAVVTLGAVAYFGPDLLQSPGAEEAPGGSQTGPEPAAPLIPDTEESVRGRARERFV